MIDAKSILNFSFSRSDFGRGLSNKFLEAEQHLETQISDLKILAEKLGKSDSNFASESLVPQVFRKFKHSLNKTGVVFSKKELRTLCYSLNYLEHPYPAIFTDGSELNSALNLVKTHWGNSYTIGLFNCYLKNWNTPHRASFDILHEILTEKLKHYSGSRRLLQSIIINAKFYNSVNGDVLLGSHLYLKNIPVSEVTTFLSLPENWITYPYFSKVILAYFDRSKDNLQNVLQDIEKVLLLNSANTLGSLTSKLAVSKMIIWAEKRQQEQLQDEIKDIAFKLIGDPAKSMYWRPSDSMSETEKIELAQAKEILNGWITRRFITVFFEACINDERRKKFWLRMAAHISSFHVFGPASARLLLKRDKRITQYVDSRFEVTSSKKQVSAFLMYVKGYKLVEFSDPGYAFYAYSRSNLRAPSADKMYSSVDDFRDGELPMAVYRSGSQIISYSDEGRITHADGDIKWEEVFKRWISKKLAINV